MGVERRRVEGGGGGEWRNKGDEGEKGGEEGGEMGVEERG